MVPNCQNWEQKLFKSVLKLDRGSSPRPIVDFMTDADDGVNWIKIGDTKKGELYINSTKEKITPEGAKKSRKVSKGEIIVSNSMSYGQPYILNIDGYIHDGWFVIRNYEKHFEKNYLLQFLGSELIQRQYKRLAAGGVVSNISSDLVYAVKATIPPLPEQRKIAKILSTWDKAISTTEKLIDASLQQKKALMQQLLTGKKRLGQKDSSISYKKTKYGKIPSDWDYPAIKEISKQITKKNTESQDLPVLSCSKHDGFVDSLKYFKKKVYSDDTSGYRIIPRHCFGFPSNHIEEGSIGLQDIYEQGIVSPIYVVFSCDKKRVNNLFLYAMLKTEHYRQIFCAATNASVDRRGSLRWKEFSGIHVPLPSLEEQQKIASVLTAADKEIELLQAKLAHLKDEKKALMQQLLTGKRRVKVDENVAA
ncbi:restriction endonuclease subunit S [Providencia rettgeri]